MAPVPCGTGDVGVPFVAEVSIGFYSLHFYQLCFCHVDCCLLYKEASMMRTKSCTDLWLYRYEFRGQFDIMSIYQNNNSRFTLWDLSPLLILLDRFIVPGLWNRLKFNQKMTSYHNDIHTTIAHMAISCIVVYRFTDGEDY